MGPGADEVPLSDGLGHQDLFVSFVLHLHLAIAVIPRCSHRTGRGLTGRMKQICSLSPIPARYLPRGSQVHVGPDEEFGYRDIIGLDIIMTKDGLGYGRGCAEGGLWRRGMKLIRHRLRLPYGSCPR